jgi:ZIP family zinc transporter
MQSFASLHPILQALIATGFTWSVTALGAATVFLPTNISGRILDALLGFAAGVMLAASYWSLLAPSIETAATIGATSWLPAAVGFLAGAVTLRLVDYLLPHLHVGSSASEAEGIRTTWKRTTLLVTAITLHNIPEGLAVGVAFGAVAAGLPSAQLPAAIALTIGIGLQNFPEGVAVAAPLRREGLSRFRCFWYGQLSAVVEPLAGVVGAAAVLASRQVLPYALAFAAGAMVFVVIEEVIPEAQRNGHADLATMAAIAGFIVMMVLDVALG